VKGAQGRRSPLKGLGDVLGRGFSRSGSGLHLPDHIVKSKEKAEVESGTPGRKLLRKYGTRPAQRVKVRRGIPVVVTRNPGRRGYTRTPLATVKVQNRRRNKAARIARRRNRVK
jgi:hypothetical protein